MRTVLTAAAFAAASLGTLLPLAAMAVDPAPALPATPGLWRAAALRDVKAAYALTLANHAGAHDPHNPAFLDNLEAARAHGESLAARVTDGGGYQAALLGFTSRIQDGHAGVYPSFDLDAIKPSQWPGFIAAWRGDLFVHAAEASAAREGERIVSCDGRPARQLLDENVFGFIGRRGEEGQWWSQSRHLFIDYGNPFIQRPQRCVFELAGRRTERLLSWRVMPQEVYGRSRAAVAGETLPVGLTEPRKNLFWVAMPSFAPSDQERADYQALYRQVSAQRERFLKADAVVVDLRGNQGGSSEWSHDFAAILWGKDRLARRDGAYTARQETWYRPSAGNIAHVRGWVEERAARGETENAQEYATLEANLRTAQAAGKPYFIKKDAATALVADPQADLATDPAPFTRPFYVIVPGNCASACLDAIDYFKLFPNTKLVGAPSSADSTYMEVRVEALPGGLARVVVPVKLYVNRPRGNGRFYRPDIPVNTLMWTTAGFVDVVERDLARGGARKAD